MKCLTKERFLKILVEQFELESITNDGLKKEYLDKLRGVVDGLYDVSKDVVEPLSKEETYIFRKKYGILDSGACQSYSSISRETNLSHKKVYSIVDIACRKIRNYSVSYVETPRVEESNSNDYEMFDSILVVPIDKLDISVRSYNCLIRAGICTLGRLTSLSTKDLTKIRNFGQGCIYEIVDKVHECGLKFTDEDDKWYESKSIIDREELIKRHEILREKAKIAQAKQAAFLNKVNRKQKIKQLIK